MQDTVRVCVLSPSLKGLGIVDNPKEEAEGYDKPVIWRGWFGYTKILKTINRFFSPVRRTYNL